MRIIEVKKCYECPYYCVVNFNFCSYNNIKRAFTENDKKFINAGLFPRSCQLEKSKPLIQKPSENTPEIDSIRKNLNKRL